VTALPCVERDGLVWVWGGRDAPPQDAPSFAPPQGYTTHAELMLEVPVEHGLLIENLLDLAHAPFTHTSTFAKVSRVAWGSGAGGLTLEVETPLASTSPHDH
jgi:chlorophyllide a oxygenase